MLDRKISICYCPAMNALKKYLNEKERGEARRLARKIGATPECLYMIANGQRKPGKDLAQKIHKATDGALPLLQLLYPEEVMSKSAVYSAHGLDPMRRSPCLTAGVDGTPCPNIPRDKSDDGSPCEQCPKVGLPSEEWPRKHEQMICERRGETKYGTMVQDGIRVDHPEEQRIIALSLELVANGATYTGAGRELTAMGYRNRAGKPITDDLVSLVVKRHRGLDSKKDVG